MKLKYSDETLDLRTALWVALWLFVLTKGEPDLIDALVKLIDRMAL